jgi:hypothetical protein
VRGVIYHVATRDTYLRNRGVLDPHLHPPPAAAQEDRAGPADDELVIWRDSDVMDPREERSARMEYARERRRSLTLDDLYPERPRCAHDTLPWNKDPLLNPVLRRPSHAGSWYDPLGLIGGGGTLSGLLAKRDDIAGSGSSTK